MTPDEVRARRLLAEVYTPEGVDRWLERPHRCLDGAVPLDLIEQGDGERVLRLAGSLKGMVAT